jgi:hypothetical protein
MSMSKPMPIPVSVSLSVSVSSATLPPSLPIFFFPWSLSLASYTPQTLHSIFAPPSVFFHVSFLLSLSRCLSPLSLPSCSPFASLPPSLPSNSPVCFCLALCFDCCMEILVSSIPLVYDGNRFLRFLY